MILRKMSYQWIKVVAGGSDWLQKEWGHSGDRNILPLLLVGSYTEVCSD